MSTPSQPSFERIKNHIKKHKVAYSIGAAVVIAGITYAIMRGRIEARALCRACGPETADTLVTNRPLFSIFSGQRDITIRQEIGRPPYLIHDLTDDLWYRSQTRAAQALGASHSTVTRHLQGLRDHVGGHHLERVYYTD